MSAAMQKDEKTLIPSWIKAELFEEFVKDNVKEYKQMKEFKAFSAMAPGENYSTIMLRIEMSVETKSKEKLNLSYMLKIPHDHEFIKKISEVHNAFHGETYIYREVLPELEQMYADVDIVVKFGPKCFQLPIQNDYLLLEDLRRNNFKNANRLKGFDMEHMKLILLKLAQYHAASATRVALKGEYWQKYSIGFFNEVMGRSILKDMYKGMAPVLMQCIEQYNGHEAYLEDLRKYHSIAVDELFELKNNDANEFKVLNHGDCWVNNIMCQYGKDDKLTDILFVDYQIAFYGSPAYDLYYFIFSSAQCEIKLKFFDYFIKFYHEKLTEHLELLKYPKTIPTLKDIHMELIKYGCVGYNTLMNVMGAALLPPTDVSHFENFLADSANSNKFRYLMFSNDNYRRNAEVIFPWLQNRGVFESSSN